ncbi:hypothetical protein AWM70_20620 [Paenibacillus yonginensis]|uniref:Uncharacterized protein n=1 Tax=Paenibacillus yonginensis TaxID=1462996 RepID=A0A1B1N5J0_9BACL|nr:hypothetical protein AWM70_20620 [Paenibacillus yonginensis]
MFPENDGRKTARDNTPVKRPLLSTISAFGSSAILLCTCPLSPQFRYQPSGKPRKGFGPERYVSDFVDKYVVPFKPARDRINIRRFDPAPDHPQRLHIRPLRGGIDGFAEAITAGSLASRSASSSSRMPG